MSTFTTILCAVNLIENTDDIVFYTRELAQANNAKVILFNSLPRVDNLFDLAKIHGGADALRESTKIKAQDFLDKLAETEFTGIEVRKVISDKTVADDIAELVEEYCADLVVIGSYSTKGFGGFFNTDSSKSVIGQTRVPVFVVPNDLSLECQPNFE